MSPRVSFDITRLNFRGRDHTVTLKTRYGNLEKLALLGYEDPRWFDAEHLSLNLTTFYEQTNDVKTFTAKRLEGAAELKQVYSKASTLLYRFIYRRVSHGQSGHRSQQYPTVLTTCTRGPARLQLYSRYAR